jgi:hypothetical protein
MRIAGQLVDLTDTIRVDLVGVQQVIGVERRGVAASSRASGERLTGPLMGRQWLLIRAP